MSLAYPGRPVGHNECMTTTENAEGRACRDVPDIKTYLLCGATLASFPH
jgi:hypothetical protein